MPSSTYAPATQPTLVVGLVRMLLGAGAALGVPRPILLAEAGLTEADLIDPDRRVPLSTQLAIGRALVDASPGRNVALAAMPHFGVGSMGALGYALSHSARLGDALQLFIRHQRLVTDAVRWRLVGERVHAGAHPALAELGHPIEHIMCLWVALGRHLTGVDWSPRALHFSHAPLGDPAEHAALLGVEPVFGADENMLDLGGGLLDLPVRGARVELQPGLLALLQAGDPATPDGGETTVAVESTLREHLAATGGDKADVARRLGISERTLGRRLKAENTRFQDVLDRVRASLARHWLADPGLAIYEVAFMLGYSETSAFHRAFRRWTGLAPAVWRAEHARPA